MSVKHRPREVVNIISSAELTLLTLPVAFAEPIEVRERQDGTWRVFYADPAWIACSPVCEIKHKHDRELRWIETHYEATSYADAREWAEYLSEGREPRVVPFVPLAERNRQRKILTTGV